MIGKRKSGIAIKNYVVILLIFFTWILCCLNTDNADYEEYVRLYHAYGSGELSDITYQVEWAYQVLGVLAYKLGLSFFGFRLFLMTAFIMLLIRTFVTYTKNYHLVWMLYLLYPFLVNCVQIRNAMAAGIILYSLKYLYTKKTGSTIKFFVSAVLAAGFHISSLVYLFYYFAGRMKVKSLYILSGMLFFLQTAAYSLLNPERLARLANMINSKKLISYGKHFMPLPMAVKHWLPILVLYLLLLYCYETRKRYIGYQELRKDKKNMLLYKVSVSTICFLPMIIININFSRLYMFMLPLLIITILNFSSMPGRIFVHEEILVLFMVLAVIAFLAFMLIGPMQKNSYEQVTKAVLHNNWMLDFWNHDTFYFK